MLNHGRETFSQKSPINPGIIDGDPAWEIAKAASLILDRRLPLQTLKRANKSLSIKLIEWIDLFAATLVVDDQNGNFGERNVQDNIENYETLYFKKISDQPLA